MALSAALPVNWSPMLVYFGITIILGLLDWPGLARAVRSKLLALREEDFAPRRVLMGATPARIIGRHLLPSFTSHLIASATLSIPGMILGETALSLPRPRPAAAGHQLGRAAERGAEHQRGRALSLADAAGGAGDRRGARLQLLRRRPARRRRSVQVTGAQACAVLVQSRTGAVQRFVENRHPLDDGSVASMPINDLLRFPRRSTGMVDAKA